jgi:hypothetical protein
MRNRLDCVAVTQTEHNEPSQLDRSGDETKQLVHKTDFACCARMPQHAVTAVDHSHDLEAL